MSTTKRAKTIIMGLILACVLVSSGWADKLELQQKLSKNITISLNDVTIAEALEKIGKEAGVKFVLSDEAEWKLPYGAATRLSVVLDGPLADSMTEMLNAFFMRYAVGDQELTIYPRAELEHVIGRPSTKQLELLKDIYTKPIEVYLVDKNQETVNIALGQEVLISPMHVQGQLNNLLRQLVGKQAIYVSSSSSRGRPPTRTTMIKKATETEPDQPEPTEIELPTPVTIVQLLKQVNSEDSRYEAVWYLSRMDFAGQMPEIHVLSDTDFRNLKYRQKIDISYEDESLDKILRDLAGRGGYYMKIDPRAILNKHVLSVNMQNISIAQAMRSVADMAGLLYDFSGSQMMVHGFRKTEPSASAKPRKATSTTASAGKSYVGKVSIPMDGGKYFVEFMLRESDLTDELKKLREEKLADVLGRKSRPMDTPPEKSGDESSKAGK